MNLELCTLAPTPWPETAAGRHRVFFALRPDAPAVAAISRLTGQVRARHGIAAPAVPPERLHISLSFVGSYPGPPPGAEVERARCLAATVALRPFVVSLNRVVSWKRKAGPRPLVLVGDEGVIGIDLMRGAIHAALAAGGLVAAAEPDRWPHLTLLWGQHDVAEMLREPVSWTVREFVLLDSPVGEGRHARLGHWTLAG